MSPYTTLGCGAVLMAVADGAENPGPFSVSAIVLAVMGVILHIYKDWKRKKEEALEGQIADNRQRIADLETELDHEREVYKRRVDHAEARTEELLARCDALMKQNLQRTAENLQLAKELLVVAGRIAPMPPPSPVTINMPPAAAEKVE